MQVGAAANILPQIDSVEFTLTGPNLAQPLVAIVPRAKFLDNKAVIQFNNLPAGAITISAIAKDAAGAKVIEANGGGAIKVGASAKLSIDAERRAQIRANHSATHLLHAALRNVLGPHVAQKGSLVEADRFRFDFSHGAPVTADELDRIETEVNAVVRQNAEASIKVMAPQQAIEAGALALFGEKYGDEVRVLSMGGATDAAFSTELCGGTHVSRTGDIGFFKVLMEGGVAAGIRRVEAVTGEGALAHVQRIDRSLADLAGVLRTSPAELQGRVGQVLDQVRALEKELGRLKSKMAASQGDDLFTRALDVKGVKLLAAALESGDAKALRETMDKLKDKLKSAVIVLGGAADGKVALIAGVTPDLVGKVKAGELVNFVAQQVGGKGGGRADMAQAGGTEPAKLPQALAAVEAWVSERL
jgi:alanyl-tRNA synthetase